MSRISKPLSCSSCSARTPSARLCPWAVQRLAPPNSKRMCFTRRACNERNGHFFNFSGLEHRDPLQSVELLLNHTVRFGGLPASYYRLVQPYQAHTCIPDTFVYCYSFALHPEDTCTPSGSANFSRIDNINMKFTLQEGLGEENVNVNIYALNWNVIRFKSGMAGLAYAN